MTTKAHSPTPFSRFSIFKSPSSSPSGKRRTPEKAAESEDNWYIPYNGPFEAPRQPYIKPKERDSWGDSLYGDDDDYDDGRERGGSGQYSDSRQWQGNESIAEMKGRPRARTTSMANEPNLRQRQAIPSYINIDASGGVGESPSPRTSRDTAPVKRSTSTFANIFNFSSSSSSANKLKSSRPLPLTTRQPRGREPRNSATTEDEDYYNSYYSTLVTSPLRRQFDIHPSSEDLPSSHTLHDRPGTTSPISHPYAFPIDDHPHTAPLVSTNSHDSDPFRSPPMRPSQSTGATAPSTSFLHPRYPNRSLKNTISSPDLRQSRRSPKLLSIPKVRDRWLSPETWCDALFLPRPRLKDGSIDYGKRIVSPPGSPVAQLKQADMLSRVVAHSKSMVNLQQRQDPGPSTFIPRDLPSAPSVKVPRPKSFALDDLALPSPAPSLSRVLEEGQILEHQRKKWQMQATSSFQNSRTRNLSRARTKSQTKRDKGLDSKQKHPHMDFLAARSFAGNQDPIPVLTHSPTESRFGTIKSSHGRSNSLSKTLSMTKTHSRTHSRSDSWGKSAMKLATGVLCNGGEPSPYEEKQAGFEDALHTDGTRVIRFEDPSTSAIDPALLSRDTPSQASSGADVRVGIALSTPPMEDRESIRLPSHPYAQGGVYSYSSPVQADFAGPHPSSLDAAEPERTDVSLRHRLPPRAAHPYALYADHEPVQQQAIPKGRVTSEVSDSSKMWAQLGDGELREIRPDEIQYSPYMTGVGSPTRSPVRQSGTIYDMVGVAEALANAVRSRDSGFGGSDEHPYSSHLNRQAVEYDATRPVYRQRADADDILGPSSKSPSPASSPSVNNPTPPPVVQRPSPSPYQKYSSDSSTSNDRTPDTSSSHASPRPLGNVDDLDNFRDLFYRPNLTRKESTRSQLSNLARQLSQEFEELNQGSDRHLSSGTHASHSGSERSGGRREAIQFVFSDIPEDSSGVRVLSQRGSILPFHPSITIPEDVESSSVLEKSPDEESDEPFRLGHVEQIATPPAVSSTHRISYTGQFESGHHSQPGESDEEDITIRQDRARSTSLQPPASDPSRTSYTTNSVYSRMSNLSDFPVPPIGDHGDTPGHMSFVSSYFELAYPQRSSIDRRLTFGDDAEIDELLDHLNHGR